MNEFRWFRDDLCDRCGECLQKCPVLDLPEAAARADVAALIDGDFSRSRAFARCTTCNVCDFVCPKSADPYELILERYGAYGREHGLPFLARMIFPTEPENIWSGLRLLMEEDELSMLRAWRANLDTEKKEILLTGFYTNIVPYLAAGAVLDELRPIIAGSEGLWGCGGDTNKLGAAGLTEQVIQLVLGQFARMGVRRVYCFMEAEAAMLAEVLPRRYGADFGIEVLPLDYWLLEKLERGDIEIASRLGLRATVHDNCMSRYFGGRPQEVVRRIAEIAGCELVEMEHNRFNGLCCGWAATIPTLYGAGSDNALRTLMNLLHSLYRRLKEAEATGAEVVITSCPACYIFLSLIRELTNARIEVRHPLEIVQMAAGQAPPSRTGHRCWDILAVATNLLLKWASSRDNRRRFFPKPIDPSALAALPAPSRSDARRIVLIARLFRSPLVQNPLSRALIAGMTKLGIAAYQRRLRRSLAA